MTSTSKLISRHIFSLFISITLALLYLLIVVSIQFFSSTGPISDMAGVAVEYGCPIVCVFVILPILLSVAGISEMGRIVLEDYLDNKFKWWITAPVVFLLFILISYAVIFLLGHEIFISIHKFALSNSIKLSIFGTVYWMSLQYSKNVFIENNANKHESN